MDIKNYQEGYLGQVVRLFEGFQDYLIGLDPLKRLTKIANFGEKVVTATLKEVSQNRGVFYVAVDKEEVLGFAVGIVESPTEEQRLEAHLGVMGRITELYVDIPFRGQGIGKKLTEETERYLKEQGCEYIWVEVFVPNVKAHEFYKSVGYTNRDVDMIKKI